MNAELRAAKVRIKEAARVWKQLTPPGWTIKLLFIEGSTDTESPEVVCETKTSWEYHTATLRWSLPNTAGLDQDDVDAYYVHEMMHVYLGALEAKLRDEDDSPWNMICEHTVEALSRAFLRLVP